jgi:hypothetical protein
VARFAKTLGPPPQRQQFGKGKPYPKHPAKKGGLSGDAPKKRTALGKKK